MKDKLNPIRYATPYFMYILSLFIITNLFGIYCNNTVSILAFLATSIIIYLVLIKLAKSKTRALVCNTQKAATFIAILTSFIFETVIIQRLFSLATEKNTGSFGRYVLAIIILGVAFICAFGKSYTALKMSNILFVIPIATLFGVLYSFFIGKIDFGTAFVMSDNTELKSILKGIIAAILLFADSYIINIMQKSEKCYSQKNASLGFIVSAAVCTAFGILLNAMFGNGVISHLSLPVISAVGIIPGFDFEEIIMFAVSVFILYRFICKLCVLNQICSETAYFKKNEKLSVCFTFILCSASVLFGTNLFLNSGSVRMLELFCAAVYFISFVLIEFITSVTNKNKI